MIKWLKGLKEGEMTQMVQMMGGRNAMHQEWALRERN